MSTKLTIVSTLIAAASMSTNVQAREISLQDFVGHMVTTAVNVTQQEVRQNVQQAVANTSYSVFNAPGASVKITDLAAGQTKKSKEESAEKQAE
ncbi:hypothetical protein [Lacimicrobium alkaliphilum]|uniref:DUF1471 domain-containing protein n=1 Tax=Lacimicrobium alkaliphilum TaxID=1526571 RepID=A0ABQ1RNH0_9ALTE|nr:hypothetical protein [Lacimicrobium alkaliphilum]GGD72905.1 hypothetical protein GCM10011357_29950 [Lacimicrobium alkaliphilum]